MLRITLLAAFAALTAGQVDDGPLPTVLSDSEGSLLHRHIQNTFAEQVVDSSGIAPGTLCPGHIVVPRAHGLN